MLTGKRDQNFLTASHGLKDNVPREKNINGTHFDVEGEKEKRQKYCLKSVP